MCTAVHIDVYTRTHGILLLAGAIASEVAATTAMKYSEGFSKLWPSLLTALGYVIAFVLLAQTLKTVVGRHGLRDLAGVGTAAVATIGQVFLGEALRVAKIAGLALIIGGVVVLNLGGAH